MTKVIKKDNVEIIYIEGNVNISKYSSLERDIKSVIEMDNSNILLNFEETNYMSSAGFRILIETHRLLETQKRKLALCNIHPRIMKVFDLLNITEMFNIFSSENEALSFFKKDYYADKR